MGWSCQLRSRLWRAQLSGCLHQVKNLPNISIPRDIEWFVTRTSCYLAWIASQYGLTATETDHTRSEKWSTGCPEFRSRSSPGILPLNFPSLLAPCRTSPISIPGVDIYSQGPPEPSRIESHPGYKTAKIPYTPLVHLIYPINILPSVYSYLRGPVYGVPFRDFFLKKMKHG